MPVTDITLNKIVDIIKAAAECHTMLNDVFVGEDSSKGFNDKEKRELNYPYLWIDFAPSSLVISDQKIIQTKVYNIVLFVADKQYDNIKNDVEILSDTEGILSDIIQYVLTNKELKEWDLSENIKGKNRELHISISKTEEREFYPLSSNQKRIYILQQMDLESSVYNMPVMLKIGGEIDRKRIEIRRSEIFG